MSPEIFILMETAFIAALILFFIMNKDITYGIYMWLLASLLFQYQKASIVDSILPDIFLGRIIFVFLAFIFIVQVLIGKRRVFSLTKIEYSMFLFCLFAVISMIWTGTIVKEGNRLNIGQLLSGYVFPFSMFFISQNIYDSPEKRRGFIKFVILTGVYLSFTAIFEHFKIDKLVFPKYILDADFGIHFGRARGPFGQAAVNGTALGFAFSAIFYFLFNSDKGKIWRLYSMLLLAITPLAIFFTYTRAAWLGAMSSLLIVAVFIFKQSRKAFAVTLVIFCVIAFFIAPSFLDDNTTAFARERLNQEDPVYARLNLYAAYMNMFINNPVFGVGFMKFSDNASRHFSNLAVIPFRYTGLAEHDTFSCILAEMGLIGITLILIIYGSILSASIRLYKSLGRHNTAEKGIVITFWGCMAVYILNSVFIQMRSFEFINSMFFIFAGIICRQEKEYSAKAGL